MYVVYSLIVRPKDPSFHIRPYPLEHTGSRPLSPSQTSEGRTSTQVGDHWGILGVVIAPKTKFPIGTDQSGTRKSSRRTACGRAIQNDIDEEISAGIMVLFI
ncbi:hypothetical protein M0657_001583 [Pyricularia oryzae]|uniref:Uncharacterized protein n=1 Tax=Pyricularia oryzae (strain Y34) TaxID=1143189 RepID=A0AA97NU30_PYRO3|nr:hypothetical protein OOU_Y34scaffold00666g227 [Pyricularia oryzae Y34]KAI7929918.1 hypothetical protein M9X92_001036 [Pyricularia oryzae]KAI7930463.1 hypothetical protein M0657_001583 [Pyricularia oryzae]